jgi:Protein kinase domain
LITPARRWLAATGLLLGTVAGLVLVNLAQVRRGRTAIVAAVVKREAQLSELVTAQLQALELRGQNAGANPRLVAALTGNVSRETLRDLFNTESWWQPFRDAFASTYLAAAGGNPVHITGKADVGIDAAAETAALVTRARQSRASATAIIGARGWAHVVVAVPVLIPNGASPVLLLTQPFDGGKVNLIAERTGEAVVLSDGRQALVGAGPAAETAVTKQAIGREESGQPVIGSEAAMAIAKVAPGLFLISHVAAAPIVAQATAGLAFARIGVGLVGGGLFLVVLFSILRPRKVPISADPPISATATEASSGSRYVLLQRIGGGGMAEVHLAVSVGERGFRRPCVVKRLRPELAADSNAVAQFTDEATLASSLVHANIVPIFDFARVGSQYFLVEEYIVGRDFGRLVRRARAAGKPLTPDLVAYVAVEALKALDYAHGKRDHDGAPLGIVHRDVSPENLMVTVRGEVQLLDFGVIKIDESRKQRTDSGELKGNLTYIAPEQARGLQIDGRADLFSLGLVIYFALTGEPLYGTDTGYDLLVRAASGPGPAEVAKVARLPEPFASVLSRVLNPRADLRFPSAAAFAEALGSVPADASARLGALISELFGDELAVEQQNLSTGAGARVGTEGQGALVAPPGSPMPRLQAGARGNN